MTHIPHKYRVDGGKCPASHRHDDDGITGGQGRTASSLRDGYVYFGLGLALMALVLGLAVYIGTR